MNLKKYIPIIIQFVSALIILFSFITIIFFPNELQEKISPYMIILIPISLIVFIIFSIINKEPNTYVSSYSKYLSKSLEDNVSDKEKTSDNKSEKNIIALMLKNSEEADEYFKISKLHVNVSFFSSVFASFIGITLFIIAIFLYTKFNDINLSIISVTGGVIIEVIAGTIFWVHNKSALQLNHYYNALHENEKFLSTVNLIDKLPDEKKYDTLIKIIESQLN